MTAELQPIAFNTDERLKYETAWTHDSYRLRSPAEHIFHHIMPLMPRWKTAYLDFGCGTGRILEFLQEAGHDVLGIDIAHNCLDAAMRDRVPLLIADLSNLPPHVHGECGICVDVLEHLPPETVHQTVSNIAQAVSDRCFIRVANFPESHGKLYGTGPLHLTLMSREHWHALLELSFRRVDFIPLKEDESPVRYSFMCYKS